MSAFKILKDSYYHRVAAAPDEQRTDHVTLSDIVLHLPVLEWFASKCKHVTEFGVREGCSTVALLAGVGRNGSDSVLHSYDIERTGIVGGLQALDLPCRWEFHQGDTGSASLVVEPTDMLFIDTLHFYEHVQKELLYHGEKAAKYLAFHDSYTCGVVDFSGHNPKAKGIRPAIEEFVEASRHEWEVAYETTCNNGLLVLERKAAKP
jgi:hypothetical protein